MGITRGRLAWRALSISVALCAASGASVAGAAQRAPEPEGQRSVLDGVFTASQAGRGERTFKISCSACHTVNDLTGSGFSARWVDGTVGDIFDFVTTAMPEGNPGSLLPGEYADVLAFFLRQSGYPAGEQELPADKVELAKVKIEALPRRLSEEAR